jgi:hypothetical protein
MDMRKQDFHAKFFAGISEEMCEVMSGSANLVRGPSLENISFRSMPKAAFEQRYVMRLKLQKGLPAAPPRPRRWVLIDQTTGSWRATEVIDAPYLRAEAVVAHTNP